MLASLLIQLKAINGSFQLKFMVSTSEPENTTIQNWNVMYNIETLSHKGFTASSKVLHALIFVWIIAILKIAAAKFIRHIFKSFLQIVH